MFAQTFGPIGPTVLGRPVAVAVEVVVHPRALRTDNHGLPLFNGHAADRALQTSRLGCVVMGTTGVPQRVCREGPIFASDELVWEGAWSMPEAAAR